MLKKSMSILLTVVMLLSVLTVLPISAFAEEADVVETGADEEIADVGLESTGYSALDNFINDGRWTNGASWAWNKSPLIASFSSWGCCAYCADYVKYCYGYNNPRTGAVFYSVSEIRAGDVLTVGNQSDGTGHWFVCLKRSGNSLYVAEGNIKDRVRIGWNYTISGNKFAEDSRSFTAGYHYDPAPDPTPQGHVMSEAEGAGRTIPDGDYWICSKIAQNYFLDIPGDNFNTQSGTNLETWIWDYSISMDFITPGKWDAFHFKYLNNGFYQITQYNTNLAIDVANASLDRGANVQMYSVNNAYAQQWSIEKTDSGYKLRARCNNYYMDIDSGIHKNGTNVLTWEGHDGIMQRFSFIPYAPDEKPLADGIYAIQSSLSKKCYLDVAGYPEGFTSKSNVQIYDKPDDYFQIEYAGKGYYRVYEAITKYAVEVVNEPSYLDKNKNVMLYTKNNSRGQFWKIKENTDGTYFFINELSGYYMDVYNGSTEVDTNVQLHPYNGSTAQRWIPYRVLQDDMVTVSDVEITRGDIAIDPQIIVMVDGKSLTQNTDYTVTTEVDIANGKGTVTVTGKGGYCGSVTKEFHISVLPILGDVDGDGEVTSVDAAYIQRYDAMLKTDIDEETLMNADVDGNGLLEIIDATFIQRHLVHMETPYRIAQLIE